MSPTPLTKRTTPTGSRGGEPSRRFDDGDYRPYLNHAPPPVTAPPTAPAPSYVERKPSYSGFQVIKSRLPSTKQNPALSSSSSSSKENQDFHSPPPLPPYLTTLWSSTSSSSSSSSPSRGGLDSSDHGGGSYDLPSSSSSSYHSSSSTYDRNDHYNPHHHTFAGTSHRFSQVRC